MRHGFNEDGGNWSGYAAQGSGFSSVTSPWAEPSVTCNSTNDLFAPWVGIDGYGSATVEQTGVATDCSSGRPVYQGWYEMYPAAPVYYSNPVAAGDHITATVTRSGMSYTLTLADTTQGWTKTTTQTLTATNASVEVIMESPTAAYPNFGSVNFTGSQVDGGTLGSHRTGRPRRQQLGRLRGPHRRAERRHGLLDQLPARVAPSRLLRCLGLVCTQRGCYIDRIRPI